MPAVNCDTKALLEAAKCFECIPVGMQMQVIMYLLNQGLDTPLTVQQLLDAPPCEACIPDGIKPQVISYLLCEALKNA